jgi:hypothetical protein
MPVKYPKYELTNPNSLQPDTRKSWEFAVANFGIGYPF